jgi:hypothetical protein
LAVLSLQCDGTKDTAPTDIDMVDGNQQRGVVGQPLPNALVVEVTDESGDPVPGVDVQWAAQGGGSVSASVSKTGSNGRASVERVLGPEVGQQTTTATAPGLKGSPVTFVATAGEAGDPGSIAITTNPPVTPLDGEVFDPVAQPAVQVKDISGVPLSGVVVTATIGSGGGTLEGTPTATTDVSGTATFGDLGIRGTGSHSLVFTAGSVTVTSSTLNVSPLSGDATTGSWGPVVNWDIVPLHINLMPNGKVFAWGKRDVSDTLGLPRIWDPATGAPSGLPAIGVGDMLFCAGHTLMPDGRLMVNGGHNKDDAGINVTYFFSQDGAPQQGPDMAYGRWYPTLTVLGDGRVLSMAGRDFDGNIVTVPELWENGQWVQLTGAGAVTIPYYPRNYVAPDGRIFYAGERITSRWFTVDATGASGRGVWSNGPTHIWRFNRDYGTAAMYDTGKILYVGGGGDRNWDTQSPEDPLSTTPTATAEQIDLNQSSPVWQSAGSMSVPRRHLNSTILPDGQVLITGGTRGAGFVNIDPSLATKQAEVWNPRTNQWTTLAANQRMRVYHSVSLLLPNGTVLHGASGDADAAQPGGGIVPVPPERNHEIFSPPYLFKGARPAITSAPSQVGYNQTVSVVTPNARQVTEVRWIRLGSVTHAFDMGARANILGFVPSESGVEVTIPSTPNLAPPGYYMLFILNRNGVPSQGHIMRVQ